MQQDLYRQYTLRHENTEMIVWLVDGLKKGTRVTLKDSDEPTLWWTIVTIGSFPLLKTQIKDSHTAKNWYKKDFHGRLKGLL